MFKFGLFFTLLSSSILLSVCDYPFRDVNLSWNERVDDLVGRLTIPELMLQLAMGGAGPKGGPSPPIPRLGIGKYQWDTECLRGDANAGWATSFPQSVGLAAAFSPSLIHDVAEATGKEVRAKYNDYVKKGQYGDHKGISCFSPVINIMRHPLWGRNQETYGEDPYMNGVYAANFVRGLQGTENRYIRANAGCKHFDAYAGPENIPTSRLSFDAEVPERDWRLTYLPAFRACVKAGTYSIMCSYNRLNGIPACANHKLLTTVLRKEWGFEGYVVSDEGALEFGIVFQKYVNNTLDMAVACVKAGCNLELSANNPAVYMNIEKAVKEGKLSEALVRERARPLFYTRMRLGEFDPPEMNPYSYLNESSVVHCPEHTALAVKAAMQTFVLLKNNKLLPISKRFNKIAVVGPMADNVEQQFGDYAADVDTKFTSTPYQSLQEMADTVNYAAGCPDNKCVNYTASEVTKAIQGTQLVVICVGTGQELESEGNDRSSMDLAGNQAQLIKDAVAASTGIPVLLLIFSAGPVNISFADRDNNVDAIIQCFFPAQAAGEALYNVITMRTNDSSPAGRLPYTWYATADQIPSMTNYSMEGRTYRYFKGTPLYPFGYGLSYSKFEYLGMKLIPVIEAGDAQYLYGQFMNIGDFDAYEVVQCYISWVSTQEPMPRLQLVGFNRYFIQKGNSAQFSFHIKAEQLAVWTDKGWEVQPGKIQVFVGGQQPNQSRSVGSNVLSASFQITGK